MLRRLALAISLLLPGFAWALGVGDITVKSALNQPLDAQIPLHSLQPGEIDQVSVSLADDSTFRALGLERTGFLLSIQFDILKGETSESGLVVLRSRQGVREPFLSFVLQVNGHHGRTLREYTVLLDPAPPSRESNRPAQTELSVTPSNTQAAAASNPASSDLAASSQSTAPVLRGVPVEETPVPIARNSGSTVSNNPLPDYLTPQPVLDGPKPRSSSRQPAPKSSVSQVSGQKSKKPQAAKPARIVREEVVALEQVPAEPVYEQPAASSAPETDGEDYEFSEDLPMAPEEEEIELVEEESLPDLPMEPEGDGFDAAGDDAAFARLNELANETAADGFDDGWGEVAEGEEIDVDANPYARPSDNEQAAGDLDSENLAGGDPVANVLGMISGMNPMFLGAGAAILVLLGLIVIVLRRRSAGKEEEFPTAVATAAASAAVASEASSAVFDSTTEDFDPDAEMHALETGIHESMGDTASLDQGIAETQEQDAVNDLDFDATAQFDEGLDAGLDATSEITPAAEETLGLDEGLDFEPTPVVSDAPAESSEETLSFDLPEEASDTLDLGSDTVALDLNEDPLSEADFHLAYGLYDEAALGLSQAIENEPDNPAYKEKLLEVYFADNNAEKFLPLATEFKASADEATWQKVAIMGQQLSPDADIFQGDIAAAEDAVDFGFDDAGEEAAETASSEDGNSIDFDMDLDEPEAAESTVETASNDLDNTVEFDLGDEVEPAAELDDLSGDLETDLADFSDESADASADELSLDDFSGDLDDLELGGESDDDADLGEFAADLDSDLDLDDMDSGLDDDLGLDQAESQDDSSESVEEFSADLSSGDGETSGGDLDAGLDFETVEVSDDSGLDDVAELGGDLDDLSDDADVSLDDAGLDDLDLGMEDPVSDAATDFDLSDDDLSVAGDGLDSNDDGLSLDDTTSDDDGLSLDLAEDISADSASEDDLSLDMDVDLADSGDDALDLDAALDLDGDSAARDDALDLGEDLGLGDAAGDDDALDLDIDFDAVDSAEMTADLSAGDFSDLTLSGDEVDLSASDITDGDEFASKLDLARAYVDMGENEMARGLLDEVAAGGSDAQQSEAQELLGRLS